MADQELKKIIKCKNTYNNKKRKAWRAKITDNLKGFSR